MNSYLPVNSVLRSLEVLKILNRQRVSSVDHIHRVSGLPKPTVVRLLETLIEAGYVSKRESDKGYRVTSQVAALSCGFHGAPLAVEAGRPWAQELTRVHKWPVAIAVPNGNAVMVCDTTCGESPMAPYHALIYKRMGLVTTALGRAYLAFCPPEERRLTMQLLKNSSHPDSEIMELSDMVDHVIRVTQKMRFAERIGVKASEPSSSVAVPIYGHDEGKILATIGMTYYTRAVRREDVLKRYVPQLKAASAAITESIKRMSNALDTERAEWPGDVPARNGESEPVAIGA
ncbi:helix-turn-helix domain-containing protein [Martelella mediterranea]|uniref:YiaKLMNOPQRS operon repressor n=1 Tax=Martelella mediterranea DSM 17316 TaxID=1122214 RepID=A0A1U9Z1B0_9HYPH|nr:helix-turn-helix domain-containing protein [Martelella mediterranea]AQZ51479.1 YiaKLMNOPQRS operon repressor [Martelella mediterranea DSM 17316]